MRNVKRTKKPKCILKWVRGNSKGIAILCSLPDQHFSSCNSSFSCCINYSSQRSVMNQPWIWPACVCNCSTDCDHNLEKSQACACKVVFKPATFEALGFFFFFFLLVVCWLVGLFFNTEIHSVSIVSIWLFCLLNANDLACLLAMFASLLFLDSNFGKKILITKPIVFNSWPKLCRLCQGLLTNYVRT